MGPASVADAEAEVGAVGDEIEAGKAGSLPGTLWAFGVE